jgi:hypothetical protein
MNNVAFTRIRCPELADFLEACCSSRLAFDGAHPLEHSSQNHIHLWALEYWADRHEWIDLEYRAAFVDAIFQRWRGRLKGLAPYRMSGFRLYLYEDLAPTVSAVAETEFGFPYGGTPEFVQSTREVLELYLGRRWSDNFESGKWKLPPSQVLRMVEDQQGSIGRRTASQLGIQVGALRILIEQMGLEASVNEIRKRHKRRPAAFRYNESFEHGYRVYERRLPPHYQ